MRIISGKHRGRKLAEFEGRDIRPTADRVKESLFNIISDRVSGATVLDLFCGSGSLGLECVSRGAARVHFNDISKDSLSVLKSNISRIGEEEICTVSNGDFQACLNSVKGKFDLIFIDPPYRFDYGAPALQTIVKRELLTDGGMAIYERDRAFIGQIEGLLLCDERKYGKTYLSFFVKDDRGGEDLD